jgi:propionyl-CoA synthetase
MAGYEQTYRRSLEDPEGFWAEQAQAIDWIRRPSRILDRSSPPFVSWFPDATLNTCFNALDRHVIAGRANQPAIVYDSPVTGSQRTYTYAQLTELTGAFAGALRRLGWARGTGW